MEEEKIIKETIEKVSKDFDISGSENLIHHDLLKNLEDLKFHLENKLIEMITNNREKLLSMLYRIDIEEEKVIELFSEGKLEEIPSGLAELIIERQLKKIRSRNMYKDRKL